MSIKEKSIYTDGRYLAQNPSWGSEDSYWKAIEIYKILKQNDFTPSSVADIGCGFGQVLLWLSKLDQQITELKGFDISPQAVEVARKSETDKVKFYLADFAEEINLKFDLVLVVDVIEHLVDYIDFLYRIKPKGNRFIFHIPLDLCCRTLLKPHVILQQRKAVGHLHYFSKEHAEWILTDAGFKIIDWLYTFSETDREKANNIKSWVKKILRRISFFLNKDLSAKLWGGYSMMILADKNE